MGRGSQFRGRRCRTLSTSRREAWKKKEKKMRQVLSFILSMSYNLVVSFAAFFLSLLLRNCRLVSRIGAFVLGCTARCLAISNSSVLTAQLLSFLSHRKLSSCLVLSRFRFHCSSIGCPAFKSCFRIRPSSVGPLPRVRSPIDSPHPIVMGYPLASEIILDVLVMVPYMCINRACDLLYCRSGNT